MNILNKRIFLKEDEEVDVEKKIENFLRNDLNKKRQKQIAYRQRNPLDFGKYKFRETLSDREKKHQSLDDKIRQSFKDFVKEE